MSRYHIETTTPSGAPIIVPIPDESLDQVRRDHAHELAEKIRVAADANGDYYQPSGMYAAADLIDPEAL